MCFRETVIFGGEARGFKTLGQSKRQPYSTAWSLDARRPDAATEPRRRWPCGEFSHRLNDWELSMRRPFFIQTTRALGLWWLNACRIVYGLNIFSNHEGWGMDTLENAVPHVGSAAMNWGRP